MPHFEHSCLVPELMAGSDVHYNSYITQSATAVTPIPPDSWFSTWYFIV